MTRIRLDTGVEAGEIRSRLAAGSEMGEVAAEEGGVLFLFALRGRLVAESETGEEAGEEAGEVLAVPFLFLRTTIFLVPFGGDRTVGVWRQSLRA